MDTLVDPRAAPLVGSFENPEVIDGKMKVTLPDGSNKYVTFKSMNITLGGKPVPPNGADLNDYAKLAGADFTGNITVPDQADLGTVNQNTVINVKDVKKLATPIKTVTSERDIDPSVKGIWIIK